MKANEAPERIWINPTTDLPKLCGHIDKNSVRYTRTDAFIDKACEFLKDKGNGYISIVDGQLVLRKGMIKDFIKYIKGE